MARSKIAEANDEGLRHTVDTAHAGAEQQFEPAPMTIAWEDTAAVREARLAEIEEILASSENANELSRIGTELLKMIRAG